MAKRSVDNAPANCAEGNLSPGKPSDWDAVVQRRAEFNREIDEAIDQAHAALRPLFDAGYRLLSSEEMEILHELMFKLGMARTVLVHSDTTPQRAEQLWQEDKARRRAALARRASLPA
jgi:hypothetical protein